MLEESETFTPAAAAGAVSVTVAVEELPPVTVEGLSVTREAGRTILWLTSDDNYSPLQRTLLMKFALE